MSRARLINRRDLFNLAGRGLLYLSGLVGAGQLLRYLSFSTGNSRPSEFDLGPASTYAPGSRTALPQANALLIHAEAGFQAISLTCTHLGCTVEPEASGFRCPCHNSQYDSQGNVTRGPAARPLERLKVEQTPDGRLILYRPGG